MCFQETVKDEYRREKPGRSCFYSSSIESSLIPVAFRKKKILVPLEYLNFGRTDSEGLSHSCHSWSRENNRGKCESLCWDEDSQREGKHQGVSAGEDQGRLLCRTKIQ